jgi:putative spermidine/putrescine transport system substrate-binding protein
LLKYTTKTQHKHEKNGGNIMQRRTFLIGASALAAMSALRRPAYAVERPFTFTSWGGALSTAEGTAFIEPFAEVKGIKVIQTSPTETAKTIAMVEAKKVEWDLVC